MWSQTPYGRQSGTFHDMAGASRPAGWLGRRLSIVTKGIAALVAGLMVLHALPVRAQDDPVLAVAVGDPESASYKIGLGVASLLRTVASTDRTKVQAKIHEFLTPKERVLGLLQNLQLAVVPADDQALDDPRVQEGVRAAVGLADGNQVLVKAELDDDVVYQITQTILENAHFLRLLYDDLGDLEPASSLERISIEVHPGAMLYYREHGQVRSADLVGSGDTSDQALSGPSEQVRPEPSDQALPEPSDQALPEPSDQALLEPKSFTVYFGFDEAALDPNEVSTIAEACRYAGTLPSAEFILGGYADTVGPETYNDGLSLARAQSVAGAIRNDPRFRDALNVISFGERELAVPTPDEVKEPKNRRVTITVVPGQRHQ